MVSFFHFIAPPAPRLISLSSLKTYGMIKWSLPGGLCVETKRYLVDVGTPEFNSLPGKSNVSTNMTTTVTGLKCNTDYTITMKAVHISREMKNVLHVPCNCSVGANGECMCVVIEIIVTINQIRFNTLAGVNEEAVILCVCLELCNSGQS